LPPGIVRFADRVADDSIVRLIAYHAFDGLAVTDSRGKRDLCQRPLTLALTGAEVRPGRTTGGNASSSATPMWSEAVCFACSKAGRARASGSMRRSRIAGARRPRQGRWLADAGPARSGQNKASGQGPPVCGRSPTSPATAKRQEDVFKELQHAIEYLDHAALRFSSRSIRPGDIVYVNATLANWLDHDLAEIGSRRG